MKSFKEYLIESKQTYDFKIKVAGELPEDVATKIKEALAEFKCESCTKGITTPIQESQVDFPELKNVSVTVFEVALDYPTTSEQVRNRVADKLKCAQSCIRVRNPLEEAETEVNHQHDEHTEEVLGKDYDKSNNQDLVGGKHTMSLLKELGKNKTTGTQYKGVNDKILAKKVPAEKTVKADKVPATKSPISGKGK
jgi:hypothetical protein